MSQGDSAKKEQQQTERIEDEFALIHHVSHDFVAYRAHTLVPNGDDAAIYLPEPNQGQIVCVDMLVEDIHFKRITMSPFHIGYKALAVNLSDIAAMGGEPHSFLVSIAIPPHWSSAELKEIYRGMKALADLFKVDLLGGDTVSTNEKLVISVTAIGQVDSRIRLLRSNSRPGDLVFVTGSLGQSAAGLELLLKNKQEQKISGLSDAEKNSAEQNYNTLYHELVTAHQLPYPHVQQGQILAQYALQHQNAIALNDVSDGLASELSEIALSSKVNLVVQQSKLALSNPLIQWARAQEKDPYHYVFYGGEDFILVGTIPHSLEEQLTTAFTQQGYSFNVIGRVEEGIGEVWLENAAHQRVRLEKKGYNHFNR